MAPLHLGVTIPDTRFVFWVLFELGPRTQVRVMVSRCFRAVIDQLPQ